MPPMLPVAYFHSKIGVPENVVRATRHSITTRCVVYQKVTSWRPMVDGYICLYYVVGVPDATGDPSRLLRCSASQTLLSWRSDVRSRYLRRPTCCIRQPDSLETCGVPDVLPRNPTFLAPGVPDAVCTRQPELLDICGDPDVEPGNPARNKGNFR